MRCIGWIRGDGWNSSGSGLDIGGKASALGVMMNLRSINILGFFFLSIWVATLFLTLQLSAQ